MKGRQRWIALSASISVRSVRLLASARSGSIQKYESGTERHRRRDPRIKPGRGPGSAWLGPVPIEQDYVHLTPKSGTNAYMPTSTLWGKLGSRGALAVSPFIPQEQTPLRALGRFALCQNQKSLLAAVTSDDLALQIFREPTSPACFPCNDINC